MDVALNSTLSVLLPVIEWNQVVQLAFGGASMVVCLLLSYIVEKHTPDEFCSKKVMLLLQLAGCFSNSLLFSVLQPFPVYPHKVFIFSGPLRTFGWRTTATVFVVWSANQTFLSCAAITTSFNHYIETMEQFKQKNILFEFFRNLSFIRRFILYALFNGVIVAVSALSLYFSIDDETDPSLVGRPFDFLRDNYGMVNFKSKYGTLEILGGIFIFFIVFYACIVFFLKKNMWSELEELRPSLSPRTFDILEQLSHLLVLVDLTPVAFYFLPTGIFILIQFLLPSLVSSTGLLLFFTLLSIVLFSAYPYFYYFLLLLGFKYYRRALVSILSRPITICRPSIAIRDVTASKASS